MANQDLLRIIRRGCCEAANKGNAPSENTSPHLSKAERRDKSIPPIPQNYNRRPGQPPDQAYPDQQFQTFGGSDGNHSEKAHHQGRDEREGYQHHISLKHLAAVRSISL